MSEWRFDSESKIKHANLANPVKTNLTTTAKSPNPTTPKAAAHRRIIPGDLSFTHTFAAATFRTRLLPSAFGVVLKVKITFKSNFNQNKNLISGRFDVYETLKVS